MTHGFNQNILRIDLSDRSIRMENHNEEFYRRYYGGRSLIAYYLLKETTPGIDALGPDNLLIFTSGIITGTPVPGSGRNSVGGKSPLTNGFGEAEAGGWWGTELKRAGVDAIIIKGISSMPVYLLINNGKVEIRDASHLWGLKVADCHRILQDEFDEKVCISQIGPAGENLVKYSCIVNDLRHVAGRTGLGAVMGSKKLKAIVVHGDLKVPIAEPDKLKALAMAVNKKVKETMSWRKELGTAGTILPMNISGGLPTRNFQEGCFEKAEDISGERMRDTILTKRSTCYACPVSCKRVVACDEPYKVDPDYGGPEYETIAAFGSNCGIGDLKIISKANELCNAFGLDTISTGVTISYLMECIEKGLLTAKDIDGIDLSFGNGDGMLILIEKIAMRNGIGNILAEGVKKASRYFGLGSENYAMHVKGQELAMHEPRHKFAMSLAYSLSPTGADHTQGLHDNLYTKPGPSLDRLKPLGVIEPLPVDDLSGSKVRMFVYLQHWRSFCNSAGLCFFLPYTFTQLPEIVSAITGWECSLWEILKIGERGTTMARAFNIREGLSYTDDIIPKRFFEPLTVGCLEGRKIDPIKLDEAKGMYYEMMGWDIKTGIPLSSKLFELDIPWVISGLMENSNHPINRDRGEDN